MSTLQGIFNTGVQGMNSQSQFLSNISTNITNVNTTGYKAQDSHFETLLNDVSNINNDSYFSVNTVDTRNVDKQGTISTTGRTYDLALNGQGFIVTNTAADGTGSWQYTRDGALYGKSIDLGTDTDGNGVNDNGTLLTTANGNYVYGWAADASGNFSPTNSLASLTPVMINSNAIVPSQATSLINFQGNLASNGTSDPTTGRQTVGLPFVDQEGNTRTLTVGFTRNLDGSPGFTLDMSSVGTDNNPVNVEFDPPNISFDELGNITNPPGGQVQALVDDPEGSQAITVDMSKLTQLGDTGAITVQNIKQDGYLQGTLNNTYFNNQGVLIGSYSNGQVRNLYKLPVANFASNDNLEAQQGNTYTETQESGGVQLAGLLNSVTGTQFVPGALETSNVDLADQFSKMIIAQRAYSSSAKVIQTADEMTQAARDLLR